MIFLYITAIYYLGYVLLSWLFKTIVRGQSLLIILPLSWAMGTSVATTALFFMALFNKLQWINAFTFLYIALTLLLLAAVVLLQQIKNKTLPSFSRSDIVCIVVMLFLLLPLLQNSLGMFLVAWDAASIWFLKAKAIFIHSGLSHNPYFSSIPHYLYSEKTYPLGIPLLIAGFFRVIGTVDDQSAQLLFAMYYLNTIFLAYSFFRTILSKISSVIAFIITFSFFATPLFLQYAHSGYADIPIGFMFMSSLTLFIYAPRAMPFILLFAAGATLLKNEGLAFLLVMGFTTTMRLILAGVKPVGKAKQILLLLLVTTTVIAWKIFTKTNNLPFILDTPTLTLASLTHLTTIIYHYIDTVLDTNLHGLTLIPVLLLVIYQTTSLIYNRQFAALAPLIIIALQLAIYTIVYMITPVPFALQLTNSFERLLLQLLPMIFLVTVWQQSKVMKF